MAMYKGAASEAGRAMQLQKKREMAKEELEHRKKKIEEELKLSSIDSKFAAHYDAIEAQLKSSTIGLVSLDEMKAKQIDFVQERERQLVQKNEQLKLKEIEAKKEQKERQKRQIPSFKVYDTILKIELCSALGQRLLLRLPSSKYNFSMRDLYIGHEKFCSTSDRDNLRGVLTEVNRPRSASRTRITRSNNVVNGVVIQSFGPRKYFHTYTFGKTQRLEKWLTLESGLNWEGRLKELCCKKLRIVTPKLLVCPLCNISIGRLKVHRCSDYTETRISTSSSPSSPVSCPPSPTSPCSPQSSSSSSSSSSSWSSSITSRVIDST